MKRVAGIVRFVLLGAVCLQAGLAAGTDRVRLYVTGPEQGVQMLMGRDLARFIARSAEVELEVRATAGTPETLLRLNETGAMQLAMLQEDASQAYLSAARRGNAEAHRIIDSVRTIARLHEEEIHFLVRSDSPMNYLHDLAAARINLGPLRSGTAMTAATMYRLMFGTAIPDAQLSFLPADEALVKLITERSVDAVAIVAPRPALLLANMKPEARKFVKLLKFDVTHASVGAMLGVYAPITARAADYPNLLDTDQAALAVRILLVTATQAARSKALTRFAGAWCKGFPRLQAEGQSQWGTTELAAPPAAHGWTPSRIADREIRACMEGVNAVQEACQQEDRLLGLCE